MTDTVDTAPAAKVPWHFWLVCALAVLWNGFGAYDFTMSNLKGDDYFRSMGMSEAMIAYFHAMPAWMYGVWIVGVWGAVLGTLLLILRRRWAVWAFAASLAGAAVSAAYQYAAPPAGESAGPMPAVIVVVAAFLLWYAWAASKKGWLR